MVAFEGRANAAISVETGGWRDGKSSRDEAGFWAEKGEAGVRWGVGFVRVVSAGL